MPEQFEVIIEEDEEYLFIKDNKNNKTYKTYHLQELMEFIDYLNNDCIIFERSKNSKETLYCHDCIHYETHYEEVVAFGEYETLTKTECNQGHNIRYEDDNYATDCPDYIED